MKVRLWEDGDPVGGFAASVLAARDDLGWVYWWPWHQRIGSPEDLAAVCREIVAILRSAGRAR